MLGTLQTQQFFASAKSIAVVPQVRGEWNYNSFLQPEYTTSYIQAQMLPANFNSSSYWYPASVSGGFLNSAVSTTASGVGKKSYRDASASALSFLTIARLKLDNSQFGKSIISSVSSSAIDLSGNPAGSFYKFVFYVKSGTGKYTVEYPSIITNISASADSTTTANLATTGSVAAYYRAVGVGSHGQTLGPDMQNNTDTASVAVSSSLTYIKNVPKITGSVTLNWTADPNAVGYNIYRSFTEPANVSFITTTLSSSYVDVLSETHMDGFPPGRFTSEIFVSPNVELYNSSGSAIDAAYFVRSSDLTIGKMKKDKSSVEAVPDVWKKVEVWFGTTRDSELQIASAKLIFDMAAEYEGAELWVDDITLYRVTEHDFFLNEYYPTESAFAPLRPGEANLHPLIKNEDKQIKKNTLSPITKPISFAVKNPRTYVAKELLNPQMQMLPSFNDKFKYYISDTRDEIQFGYDSEISINKIVLKYVTTFNSITSGSLTINFSNNSSSVIQLTSSDFSDAGLTVLYYNGASWSTTAWANPPSLTASGTLQNVSPGVVGMSFKATVSPKNFPDFEAEDYYKLHLVEFSPRLELDLSSILLSYNTTNSISAPNSNGFPISYINSNSGNLVFSNIPFYQPNGYGATVLENNSKNATFHNLLRQGVKFTGILKNTTFSNDLPESLPLFTMYSNSWSNEDLQSVSVELFDVTKLMFQGGESPEYFANKTNLFSIITTTLNIVGFSDYDFDQLKDICENSTTTNVFWYDVHKTVYENLQGLLLPHQIGATVDEYGIMRFHSLKRIFDKFNSTNYDADIAVTDVSASVTTASGTIPYIENIIPDSFSEQTSEKVGKVILTYQIPKDIVSADFNNDNTYSAQSAIYNTKSNTMASVWSETTDMALPSYNLSRDLTKNDNYMSYDPVVNFTRPRKSIGLNEGTVLIGNEIIGYSGLEYIFYPPLAKSSYISRIIRSSSDIDEAVNYVKELYSASSITSVEFNPTGKIMNLQRGLYGTPISDHKVATKDSTNALFNFYSYSNNLMAATLYPDTASVFDISPDGLKFTLATKNKTIFMEKDAATNGENFFAIDFYAPTSANTSKHKQKKKERVSARDAKGSFVRDSSGKVVKKTIVKGTTYSDMHNLEVGMFFNMNSASVVSTDATKSAYFIGVFSGQENTGQFSVKYFLSIYYYIKSGNKIVKQPIKTIPIDSVFEGKMHRLSIYTDQATHSAVVAIDNKVVTFFKDNNFNNVNGTRVGAYVKALENQSVTAYIDEFYVDTVPLINDKVVPVDEYDMSSRYYFMSTDYLDKMVNGFPVNQNPFLFQVYPQVRGIKFYDVELSTNPIFPEMSRLIPIRYGTEEIASKSNATIEALGPIFKNDLQYSNLMITPFRARFAVVNNCDEIVKLASSKDSSSMEPIQIWARHELLSEQKTLQRVIDPTHDFSIEMQSQWLSSDYDASKIAELMMKAANGFYTDINVAIFGNPLIQVGDFAKITYSLKRVGYDPADNSITPLYCLVSQVQQAFQDGMDTTRLTLKPLILV